MKTSSSSEDSEATQSMNYSDDDARDVFQSTMAEIKPLLDSLGSDGGVKGGLVCANSEGEITRLAIPSNKRITHATIIFADGDGVDYEANEDEVGDLEEEELGDEPPVVLLVKKDLKEISNMFFATRMDNIIEEEKQRLSCMNPQQLTALTRLLRSLQVAIVQELKIQVEQLKNGLDVAAASAQEQGTAVAAAKKA